MTSVETITDDTPLYTHSCACCGDPIAARHEVICESILAIDAMEHGSDVDGEFTTLYCPACLVEALELAKIDLEKERTDVLDYERVLESDEP